MGQAEVEAEQMGQVEVEVEAIDHVEVEDMAQVEAQVGVNESSICFV